MSQHTLFYKALVLFLFLIFLLACKPSSKQTKQAAPEEKGIETLLLNLETMKEQTAMPLHTMHTSYQQLHQASTQLSQTEEEIRQDLLSEVQIADQAAFRQELETVFHIGKEKAFFLRQIEYAKFKIDLAVVGIGIIRVHQVLKGENLSVKPKDTQQFIRYIKEQVQNALISEDKNYKAIVFKGIESSA